MPDSVQPVVSLDGVLSLQHVLLLEFVLILFLENLILDHSLFGIFVMQVTTALYVIIIFLDLYELFFAKKI